MATFKVGQRVRVIGIHGLDYLLGSEGVVVGPCPVYPHERLLVHLPGAAHRRSPCRLPPEHYSIYPFNLAPLTDPKADAFLESIRQLKPLPVQEIA